MCSCSPDLGYLALTSCREVCRCVWERERVSQSIVCVSTQASHRPDFHGLTSERASLWQDILPLGRPKGNIYKSSAQQILKPTHKVKAIHWTPSPEMCKYTSKSAYWPTRASLEPHPWPELTFISYTPFGPINTNMLPLGLWTAVCWKIKCKHLVLQRWKQLPTSNLSSLSSPYCICFLFFFLLLFDMIVTICYRWEWNNINASNYLYSPKRVVAAEAVFFFRKLRKILA